MFVHYKRHNYTFTSRIKRQGSQCVCVFVFLHLLFHHRSYIIRERHASLASSFDACFFFLMSWAMWRISPFISTISFSFSFTFSFRFPFSFGWSSAWFSFSISLSLALSVAIVIIPTQVTSANYLTLMLLYILRYIYEFTLLQTLVSYYSWIQRNDGIYICLSHSISFNDSANRFRAQKRINIKKLARNKYRNMIMQL